MKVLTAIGAALVAVSCADGRRHEPIDTSGAVAAPASAPIVVQDTVSHQTSARQSQTESSETPAGRYVLLFSRIHEDGSNMVTLDFQLAERENRQRIWDVGRISDQNFAHSILRADSSSIVVSREGGDGQADFLKLFLDPSSKKLVRKIDFSPNPGLDVFSAEEVAGSLRVPLDFAQALREPELKTKPGETWDAVLPAIFRAHPMPEPRYSDFARARPDRVEDGYDSASAAIREEPTAFQFVGSRAWFGKRFYDGEGSTGIGGVGYLDTTTFNYTFLKIPETIGWSVSALLVDEPSLWIGLVGHPEGTDYGGGLLRHDLVSGATAKIPIQDVISQIRKRNGRMYVATRNGVLIVENARVVDEYMVEPDINGKYFLVHITR